MNESSRRHALAPRTLRGALHVNFDVLADCRALAVECRRCAVRRSGAERLAHVATKCQDDEDGQAANVAWSADSLGETLLPVLESARIRR